ncbi:MAG TPA: hypothetical protein VK750_02555, partial [Cytophagaceae bacterium]|nr:hypothetical protein [Cytophagaceae bacterium]
MCIPFFSEAQDTTDFQKNERYIRDSVDVKKHPHNSIDLIDIALLLENKNVQARHYTPEQKLDKPHISAAPGFGYTLVNGFAGVISANLAFYSSDALHQKISNIASSITYTQKQQIIFPLLINYWSKGNKYNFVSEWRYMKYPSPNFQILDTMDKSANYTIDFSYFKFHQCLLRAVFKNFYAGAGYYLDYYTNINELGLTPNEPTGFKAYGLDKKELASGMALRLLYDSRLNQINAARGAYVNIEYRPNFTFLGSDNNWQSLLIDMRKYFKFSKKSNNVLAIWSYNWFTPDGIPPYLMLPSTGWDEGGYNTGRGYIQ